MSDVADSGRTPRHAAGARPPWRELGELPPLALGVCRRIVVVAPHPSDEIRAAGGLLRRLVSGRVEVDVLSLTEPGPVRAASPSSHPVPTARTGAGPAGVVLPDVSALLDHLDLDAGPAAAVDGDDDDPDDDDPEDDDADDAAPAPEELAAAEGYRSLGLGTVRRHRLALAAGDVAAHEADVVGALSEIVGFSADPEGLLLLAPWSADGDDDHEAAGRAAETVAAAYRVRLVRWLDQTWSWAGPDSAEVPWRRARRVELPDAVLARKGGADAAPGPREVFLV